jgi:hydrogenase nickel incorporation protein HypA/HybF
MFLMTKSMFKPMHELSVALNIAGIIKENVPETDLNRISLIRIDIGILSNISPDSLLFCFNSMKENEGFSSAALEINNLPLNIKCRNCETVSEENDFIFICKLCGSNDIEVIGGDELSLNSIIID